MTEAGISIGTLDPSGTVELVPPSVAETEIGLPQLVNESAEVLVSSGADGVLLHESARMNHAIAHNDATTAFDVGRRAPPLHRVRHATLPRAPTLYLVQRKVKRNFGCTHDVPNWDGRR